MITPALKLYYIELGTFCVQVWARTFPNALRIAAEIWELEKFDDISEVGLTSQIRKIPQRWEG